MRKKEITTKVIKNVIIDSYINLKKEINDIRVNRINDKFVRTAKRVLI